ncbi:MULTISPECIES: 3-phosphoshikimate 1-carboxyvinyltransferase [Parabacteroides]|uniref:3-phosphoshikimate 1-carboxyvinyltransferase n=3 Tax=Parabacteroides TaxID=375288 RepID=A0A6G1ZEI9_9BACT|nr:MULTISPECIES: 3-phosphoshikimate 1-carboxyvinyltransferase [Parabacteroides]EOS15731.1 3-phosphoshikimate 1-carboxyvinyltransferase [Parabacteroides goldsteinii dnLKV18]KAI4363570.1 3-phosphoshikimate 1-carboxyvinyltransferase [Parabacteroides sp. ASF519]MBF0764103.1 3-phosphoshikimate 1-carboxyvinyltransferase [Parabacteroides goldsteinii]MRX93484.1 3-phosphoshikimate 1-carboxyvinyltransferase [Parabacteroides goldsteinii]MRX95995.1 3-phosphoshikimate 1-carboxyvinyltransferase [Parabactero
MKYLIKAPEERLRASVQLPASKSISNRALILNALSYSPYDIQNLSDCDDTEVMVKALNSDSRDFDIKAAGTAMRFLTAFLSKIVGEWTITGTERMKNRPIKLLVDALNSLGARIEYIEKEGYPPLRIFGSALQGGEISLAGGVSSQYISALLMIAPLMEKGLTLHLEGNIISRPYINLTLQLMEQFGVKAIWNGQTIKILPQEYKPIRFTVESDWSAASYWYSIMALSKNAEIELLGLFKNSLQGDAAGAKLFAQLGVGTTFTDRGVVLKYNGNAVKKLIYNFVNEPDLAQTFVVTCVLLNIPFRFTGLQSLKIKETDRIEALKTELRKLGYLLTDSNDSILEWNGERCEPEADPIIATYEDHRMAMAFAPAALVLPKGLKVADPEVVTKSYPAYWEDLRKAGFALIEN